MKFKSNIESQAGIEDSASSAGTAGQILSSLGPVAGVDGVGWIDQAEIVAAGATRVLIACKNTSGATITKGTPVYQTGNVGATDVIEIAEADALISTGYLPAIGLLETDLINNAFGHVVITGELLNITTSPIDGVVPTTGDTIYLKSGGGLTLTKPTGEGNAIQNLGLVGKVSSGNAGSLTVASIMRQNDVPNLPTGKIWVGDGNTIVSDVVYLDETNERMGIRTTSPSTVLEVSSTGVNGVDISQSASNASQSGRLFFTTNTASEGFALFNSNGTFQVNSGGIPNNTSGTNRISIIGSSGNVGIGTTSPGYKLDVSGDAYIDESLNIETTISGALTYGYPNVGAGNLVVGGLNFASWSPGVITLINQDTTISAGQDLGVLQFGGKDDVTNGYANGQIICTTAGNAGTGNTGGGIFRFLLSGNITGNSPTERMRITNTGDVGIGTTAPSQKLDVAGSAQITNDIYLGRYIFHDNDTNTFIGFPSNDTFTIRTNGSDRVRVISSGNVGIGTAGPAKKLTIGGIGIGNTDGLKIEDPSNTAYGAHFSFDDGSTTVEIGGVTNNTLNDCISIARDATRTITIDTNEKVGIGTTTPSTKLHVLGTTSSVPAIGAAPSSAQFGGSSYGTLFSTLTSGRGVIQQGRSDGVLLTFDLLLNPRGGNVGIGVGTSVPAYTLDVYGTGRFTNTLYYSSLVQQSQADTKKDIANIDKNKATAIPFKQYKYKTGDTERVRYGVVVEDIEQYYPELVHIGEDGIKGVSYIDLLVKRVAELEKELEDISLTPGPKGDTGATGATGAAGANGADGSNGADGNSHLSNITSIAFNSKANRLQVNIGGTVYNFAPSK